MGVVARLFHVEDGPGKILTLMRKIHDRRRCLLHISPQSLSNVLLKSKHFVQIM